MIALHIMAWMLAGICLVALLAWAFVLQRVVRVALARPTVRRGLPLAASRDDWPTLSIIVPAHNEQRVIDQCARALRAQTYPNLEIIFVLDRCTDDTLSILQQHAADDDRVHLIENESCPDDWAGKCNAAQRGAEAATGDWLLFTDADTQFDPELCRATMAMALHHDAALLSLLSSLTYDHHFELVTQPVASMNLLRLFPLRGIERQVCGRTIANGQFMLFDGAAYLEIGGHEAVKGDLLEDIAFARIIGRSGRRNIVLLADGMLRVSMYDSHEALHRGWKRIFIEACSRRPMRLWKNALRLYFAAIIAPIAQVLAIVMSIILAMNSARNLSALLIGLVLTGWLCQVIALMIVYQFCGAPMRALRYFWRGCFNVARIMREGADDLVAGRAIEWGGRRYVLPSRGRLGWPYASRAASASTAHPTPTELHAHPADQ